MKIIEKPLKWFRKTRAAKIDTLVIHYISAINIDKKDPFSVKKCYGILKKYKISAHYLIDRKGAIYRLVQDKNVAWHSGVSNLRSRAIKNSCNDFSIGIELIGGKWVRYTEVQYAALIDLSKELCNTYSVPKSNVVGHDHIAPGRKVDPGKHFDWPRFLSGVFPASQEPDLLSFDNPDFDKALVQIDKRGVKPENSIEKNTDVGFVKKVIDLIVSFFRKQ